MKNRLALLQVFRGLACLLVVGYHLGESTNDYFHAEFIGDVFAHGYVGVDFFFVLSGFIITYIHFRDLKQRSNRYIFLKKRFIRIYPIYWIIASFYLVLLIAKGKTTHHTRVLDFQSAADWMHVIKSYLLIPHHEKFFLGVAWTLSFEVLFYMMFFIAICIGLRAASYLLVSWVVLISVNICFPGFLPDLMIFDARIIEFLIGCVVGYLILHSYKIPNYILFGISGAGVLMFLYPITNVDLKIYHILILAVVNGCILFMVVSHDLFSGRSYSKALLLVGEASYSIYLSHVIFLSLFLRLFQLLAKKMHVTSELYTQLIIWCIFLCTTLGGVIVFKFIEAPVLALLNSKTKIRKVSSADTHTA